MKLRNMFVTFLVLFVTCSLFGQTTIRVASDSSSGTYNKMLTEIISVCNDDSLNITPASDVHGGAPGNLDALVNNRADAAFLHSDVYLFNSQADPSYGKFQTLVALYPEQIHVLALRQSKTSKLSTFSYGKQEFNSLSEMTGFSVAAAGGGVITAKILSGQGGGGFNVIDAGSGDAAIGKLNSGEVAAVIFVGASPLPNIEKLNKAQYKLLPLGESISGRVQGVYRPVSINYPGLTTGPMKTMAPIATLLTRKFSTPAKVEAQSKLRGCFTKHLAELQDTGSANWQEVTAGDHGIPAIPWLDLPNVAAPAASPRTPGRKR